MQQLNPSLYQRLFVAPWQAVTLRQMLLFAVIGTLCIGTTMIASASMPYSQSMYHQPFHFIILHLVYLLIGLIAATIASQIPLRLWFNHAILLWLLVIGLLVTVFLFGGVNGSKRWIRLPGFTFQPSELAKFVMVLFTADYVVRREKEMRFSFLAFLRLSLPMGAILLLTILEPDLGATVVIAASVLTVFFLAGAPAKQFVWLICFALGSLVIAIIMEPYRLKRLVSFANPWDDPLGSDYQLIQSMLAFGNGGWFGTGLGHSVQKLAYLPEAHTDFLLAIIAEELGFVGIFVLFLLLFLLIANCVRIGHRALKNRYKREGYLAYGVAAIFMLQVLINGGMNMGMMPTKGLTMPFVSYGGTSLLISLMMIGVVLRIDRETNKPASRGVGHHFS